MSLIETANHAAHAYFDSAIMLIFFLLIGRYGELAMRALHDAFINGDGGPNGTPRESV